MTINAPWTSAHNTVLDTLRAVMVSRKHYDTADLTDMTITLIDTIRPQLAPPAASASTVIVSTTWADERIEGAVSFGIVDQHLFVHSPAGTLVAVFAPGAWNNAQIAQPDSEHDQLCDNTCTVRRQLCDDGEQLQTENKHLRETLAGIVTTGAEAATVGRQLCDEVEQLRAEVRRLTTRANTADQALADEIREHLAAKAEVERLNAYGTRTSTIAKAAAKLAEIEAARTPALENCSAWLEGHKAALSELQAAIRTHLDACGLTPVDTTTYDDLKTQEVEA